MDTTKQALFDVLKELAEHEPWANMRHGQMIANLAHLALEPTASSTWDVTDEQLRAEAQRQLDALKAQ